MKAKGYILKLSPSRLTTLRNLNRSTFSEPVEYFDYSRNSVLICFIIDNENTLTHIGLAKRGIGAGTNLSKLNISDLIVIQENINIIQIVEECESHERRRIQKYIIAQKVIPPATFARIIDITKRIAPSSRIILSRYGEQRKILIAKMSDNLKTSLAEQKETISSACHFAGIERKKLFEWDIPRDTIPKSFLDGLSSSRLREDTMVINDFRKFPGYDFAKELPFNAAVFENTTTRLTTIIANRTPLEELLGTDLIYYNETYSSFIFVQYKALEYAEYEKGFRFPNEQLQLQIDRMKNIQNILNQIPNNSEISNYRLNQNPFFLKFCSRMVFEPDNISLIPGMYIPLDMWDVLINSDCIMGPRGGKIISYETVDRYFDNTEFATIVSKAWIGSYGNQSTILEQLISETIATGKAVTIAIKVDIPTSEQRHFKEGVSILDPRFTDDFN